ncbi:hypothetical protein [Brachybacterium sp.]|uniref:hypothetical protein n=1 Tax=Brachybacterium sp. TaxID=1891286 RepID=UPI002ED59113
MTQTTRTATIGVPDGPIRSMALDLPAGWSEVPSPDAVLAAFSDGRSLNPGIETNAVLTAVQLPEGTRLRGWQTLIRDTQLAALPDLQVLDDRALDEGDESEQWYTATVMTDEHGVTILTRRWSRLLPGLGVTLTLTTLPLVDAEHGKALDALAASWAVTAPSPEETSNDHP